MGDACLVMFYSCNGADWNCNAKTLRRHDMHICEILHDTWLTFACNVFEFELFGAKGSLS